MDAISQDGAAYATCYPVGTKVCSVCRTEKPKAGFPLSRTGTEKDGFGCRCKECNRARWKLYSEKNLQKVRDRLKEARHVVHHYGVDEKFGDTWKTLDAALNMCLKITPLRKAA